MSYATAPTFEGTRIGMRRLSALSGIGGVETMGAVSDTANVLIASGWNASLINGLLQAGATDQQLTDLLNGATDAPTILSQLKAAQISASGINPAAQPAAPAGPGQSPAGATLLYQAGWTAGFGNLLTSPNTVIAQLASALTQQNISIVASSATANGPITYGIQVTVKDNIGHALVSDIKSVLDALMTKIVGTNLSGTNLSLVAYPGQALPPGTPGATDFTTWFQSNWMWVAGGFAALVIGVPLITGSIGGGRR
jgi:hypothetical protein